MKNEEVFMPRVGILIDGKIVSSFNGAVVKDKATGQYILKHDGRPVKPYNNPKDPIVKWVYIPKDDEAIND
jgi:hypothetical protein